MWGRLRRALRPPRRVSKQRQRGDVPVRIASNQWTQFDSFPQFMDGVERDRPAPTDTMTHWVTKNAGVEREFEAEITEQTPDEPVAWTTLGGEVKQAGVGWRCWEGQLHPWPHQRWRTEEAYARKPVAFTRAQPSLQPLRAAPHSDSLT